MAMMVLDSRVEERLKAEREASGADRYDEVWEGVYMMAPMANNEHQRLQARLAGVIQAAFEWDETAQVHTGANVSDREDDWTQNYRVPDVVVAVPGCTARDCGTHWFGGPDFVLEITSPGDRTRDKAAFYAAIGVRELMLIDRDPWSLELYRRRSDRLELAGRAAPGDAKTLKSDVVPVSFRLVPGAPRPRILVSHRDGDHSWLV